MVRKQPTCGCSPQAVAAAIAAAVIGVACARPTAPAATSPRVLPAAAQPPRRTRARPAHAQPRRTRARVAPARPRVGPAPAGGRALGEAAARAILFPRFRRAGFHVLVDYRLRLPGVDVTLDGFDPDARVGYEYVARAERGTDLAPAERRRLAAASGYRILVIDAAGAGVVRADADRFLRALPPRAVTSRR